MSLFPKKVEYPFNVQSTGNSTSPLCVYIVDFSLTLSPGLLGKGT